MVPPPPPPPPPPKQYGLTFPTSRGRGGGGLSGLQHGHPSIRMAGTRGPASRGANPHVFGSDSSSESDEDRVVDINAELVKQSQRQKYSTKLQQEYADALAQDESVFDYDGVYDDIQSKRSNERNVQLTRRADKRPQYMDELLKSAQSRKKESERRYERRLLREREKEDHLYGDKERFITSQFKKKLLEDKLAAIEDEILAEEEAKMLERQKTHGFQGILRNFLNSRAGEGESDIDQRERERIESRVREAQARYREEFERQERESRERAKMAMRKRNSSPPQDEPSLRSSPTSPSLPSGVDAHVDSEPSREEERSSSPPSKKAHLDSETSVSIRERSPSPNEVPTYDPVQELFAKKQQEKEIEEKLLAEKRAEWEKKASTDEIDAARERFLARQRERQSRKATTSSR